MPFRAENPLSSLMKRVNEDVPGVTVERPDLPAWIGRAVEKATDRDLEARYQTVSELVHDIERRQVSFAWRKRLRSRLLKGVAAAALLIAVGALGVRFLDRPAEAGSMLSLHLHNHGFNTWDIADVKLGVAMTGSL